MAEVRPNLAANQRAHRLALLYLGTLVVLYLGFLALDRSAPGGTSATAETGMVYFSAIAALLAAAGLWVALAPVPRSVEVQPDSVVVVEWMGRRRRFPPLERLRVTLVRRYPRSLLAGRVVEAVEVTDEDGHRRVYQVEEGVLPVRRLEPR